MSDNLGNHLPLILFAYSFLSKVFGWDRLTKVYTCSTFDSTSFLNNERVFQLACESFNAWYLQWWGFFIAYR